jgi:N-acetylglucosamine malate deacetylase 1
MTMLPLSRRELLGATLLTAAGKSSAATGKLKVLVAGAHPDDPETGCGGTIIRYTDAGHAVTALYLTRGEAGIRNTSHEDAARIRTEEAKQACAVMKAKPVFAGQVDGSAEITPQRYADVRKILEAENPDVLFTHWPIDTHRDHRICANLVYDAWLRMGRKIPLYYYEVMSGEQSQTFSPTHHVNIDDTVKRKWKACFLHKSQIREEFYQPTHGRMELFRGIEANCNYAEAFVRHTQGPEGRLP